MTTDEKITVLNRLGVCEVKLLPYSTEWCCTFGVTAASQSYSEYGDKDQVVQDVYDKVYGLVWLLLEIIGTDGVT